MADEVLHEDDPNREGNYATADDYWAAVDAVPNGAPCRQWPEGYIEGLVAELEKPDA